MFDHVLKKQTKAWMLGMGHSKIEVALLLRGIPYSTWDTIDVCLSYLAPDQKVAFTWVLLLQDKKKDAAQLGDVEAVNMLMRFLCKMWEHQPSMFALSTIEQSIFDKCIETLDACGIPASSLDLQTAAARS